MNDDARRRQAALQESLLRSLTGKGDAPEGLDRDRLAVAGHSLAVKRARSVSMAWPGLAEALSESFAAEFASYAAGSSIPALGGPLADGWAFAGWLARQGRLPAAGRLEQLGVSLHHREIPEGLVPRRGPAIRAAWLDPPGQLVLAARWSRGRGLWWTIRKPWSRRRPGSVDVR